MKLLRLTIGLGGITIALLLAPWLLLRVAKLAVPKLLAAFAALAITLIPIEIALFVIYFNTASAMSIMRAIQLRSAAKVITGFLILVLGDLVLCYALVTAVRGLWLR